MDKHVSSVAFFDLDYTLLNTSSGLVYLQEIIKQRRAPLWYVAYVSLSYQLRRIDFGETHLRLMRYVGQKGAAETRQFFKEWVNRALLPRLVPAGLDKISWHRQQGHQVVIISASIEEIVQPVAEYLGLQNNYLGSRLATKDNRYTGQLEAPLCYGQGKVYWAKQWSDQNNLPFPQSISYFYTDRSSDLPLLELTDHPVAVNPSRRLAKIAAVRGWPIERFY